ncbi:MAG: LPS assembly lipoprotein LptE [Gammaproteobacteria bacterium]
MTTLRLTFLLLIPLLLAACGFQLRGSSGLGIDDDIRIHLDTSGGGEIGLEVQEQMELTGITLVASTENPDYMVGVNNHRYRRDILSASPLSGRVQEYELYVGVDLSVVRNDGEVLVDRELLDASRDYAFDETAVLASGDEQALIREELEQLVSTQALLRLQAAIRNDQGNSAQ